MQFSINRAASIPIYRQVYNAFREQVLSGALQPGHRIPSIRELERELGVARESVKHAMADLAADGFIRRIQGKGSFVAPTQPTQAFWGVVLPFYAEFYNQMLVEFGRVAASKGIALEHACDYDSCDRQMEIVNDLHWRRANAIIVVPTRDESKAIGALRKIARTTPLLLFDRSSIASQLPYVIQDYVYGVRTAMEHLVQSGARRIAFVRDPLWERQNPTYRTMEQAYEHFCSDMPEGFCHLWNSPYEIPKTVLRDPNFDALLCANDQVACLVAGLLQESGTAVPERVQLIGYNNSDLGRFFTPQVTTVGPDLGEMCDHVSEIIQGARRGDRVELLQYVMIPKIIERQTTRGKEKLTNRISSA